MKGRSGSVGNHERNAAEILERLLTKKKHFSVCDFEQVCKMVGAPVPGGKDGAFLHALHCVNYADMSEGQRRDLVQTCFEIVGGVPMSHLVADVIEDQTGRQVAPVGRKTLRGSILRKISGGGA